jgi:TonB-linked SusC/RagA family outer membrane protein
MNLQQVLKSSFSFLLLLVLATTAFAQEKEVSGAVTDQTTGTPVEGVTVMVKGNTGSAITDAKGAFKLNAAEGATLVFSHVAYTTQEVRVKGSGPISISLAKLDNQMEDVVVIGYGTQKAKTVTGSIVNVDLKKIEETPVVSISEMLRGQVPGLNVNGGSTRPGTMPTINIRQQFSWGKDGGTPTPLIVIDDIIQTDPTNSYLNSTERLNQLDLSEVESITVLRDASAAIYGARGSQGAIVIKTKRGKAGTPRISYSGRFERMDAVSHGKVMNAKEYGIFANRFGRAAGWTPQSFFTPTELQMMDSLDYDWLQDWRASNAMQHSLNVSGGTERATFFVGGSYYDQGANLGSQDFKRYTFRAGTDVKVGAGLKIAATISAGNTQLEKSFTKVNFSDGYATGGEQNDYSVLLHMPKYIPWQMPINGVNQYLSVPLAPNRPGSANGANSLSNYNYYSLLGNGSMTYNKSFNYNAIFSAQYDIPFVKGLSVRGNYSIGSTAGLNEQNMFAQSLFQPANNNPAVNPQTSHLFTPTTVWNAPVLNRSGTRVTYDNTTATTEQINFFANYDRSFGDHNISAVFSGERAKYTYDVRYQIYENPIPGAYNGTSVSAGTPNTGNTFTNRSINGTMSYLGRVSYNYRSKYLLQFVFRSDASVKVAPQNYWSFFPAVSLGWVISDENFFRQNVSWVNSLKIRANIGETGNDNVKAFKWTQTYVAQVDKGMGFGTNGGNFVTGLTPDPSPNPNLTWDRTLQRNLGLDITLLRNRLTINWDGYYNSTREMITLMTNALNVPISTGGAFAEQNYGAVDWWGTEVAVTWSDRVGKLNYSVGLNFGLSDNEVKKFPESPFTYLVDYEQSRRIGYSMFQGQWGYRTWKQTSGGDGILRTDADIDNYWTYLTDLATKAGTTPRYFGTTTKAGMKKGMLVYEDIGGVPDLDNKTFGGQNGQIIEEQDMVLLRKNNRTYGITTNLSVGWKSFTLLAQIATSWGGYNELDRIKQGTSSTNAMWSQAAYLNDMYDSTDNPNGKYPNIFYYDDSYRTSDFWTLPSFRCVIRSMSVGYNLPKRWLDKVRVSNAKLILSGYNLWDLYNPYPNKVRNMYDGLKIDYPTLRTWALGVNLGF